MLTTAAVTAAHMHPGFGFGPWFLLIPLVWIGLLAALFAIFGRRWRRSWADGYGPGGRVSASRAAEATLAERFAKGDIDEVDYRARLEVIRSNSAPPAR